jgi:transcriptional regulator with XRE-family HTH domain
MSRSLSSPHYAAMLQTLIGARKAAGIKQIELAGRLGKPQSFVSKVERGERRVDVIELLIIVRAIGADEIALVSKIATALPTNAKL